jgi:hypothetical protein
VAFALAVGTFDAYLAVLAQILLVATVVTGAVGMLALRARRHRHERARDPSVGRVTTHRHSGLHL